MGSILGHGILDYVVVIGLTLYAVYAGLTKPHRILYIMPATLTFFFFIQSFISITPLKIVPFAFIGAALVSQKPRYFQISRINKWSKAVLIVIIISIVVGWVIKEDIAVIAKYTPEKRLIVQLFSYVGFLLIYWILRKECHNQERFKLFLDAFIWTTTILCIYGLYQVVANQFGLPFRGIVRTENTVNIAQLKGAFSFFRINSFANEPKRLSYVLMTSVLILLAYLRVMNLNRKQKRNYWLLVLLHLICTFMTYSTSVIVAFGLFIPFIMLVSFIKRVHRYYLRYALTAAFLILLTLPLYRDALQSIYEERVVYQLEQAASDESVRVEKFALDYIQAKPETVILGVGPGLYNFVINKEFYHVDGKAGLSEKGGLQPLNSAFMTLLFDFGALGVIVILVWPVWGLVFNKFAGTSKLSYAVGLPVVFFLFCTALVLNPLGIYFAFVGALYGIDHEGY